MFIYINIDLPRLQNRPQLRLSSDRDNFYVHSSSGAMHAQLRKRHARPTTFCRQTDEGVFRFGYETDASRRLESEFLDVTITSDGNIHIRRDIYCTLPLYFAYEHQKLVVSNLYAVVAAQLTQLTPDWETLNVYLAGRTVPHRRTPYKEIHTLEEQAELLLDRGTLQLISGEGRPESSSLGAPASDPHEFLPTLEASFEHFIRTRLGDNNTAFEISGGIDSSALPLYIGKQHPKAALRGITMRFPGAYGTSQMQKIHALQSVVDMHILEQKLEAGYNSPLQRIIRDPGLVMHPMPSPTEVYYEPTDHFGRRLSREGIDTVVTGIGGDELFEHIVDSQSYLGIGDAVYDSYIENPPPYTTTMHSIALKKALTQGPRPLPRMSALYNGASLYRNNTYIEHGVWPVTPFADPHLVRFCQGLPSHFKANKNILRAFFQAHGFPAALYNTLQNEDFNVFFESSFYTRTYDKIFNYLLERSWSASHGYVDASQLRETYEYAIGRKESEWLFCLYCWMCTEIDLEYHKGKVRASNHRYE